MTLLRAVPVAALALALSASPSDAYFEQVAFGARGLALGASASAAVHDASSGYWNPAGLARVEALEAIVDYSKPYGLEDLGEGAIGVAGRAFGTTLAVSWHHLGISNAYGEEMFTVSAGRDVWSMGAHRLAAGGSFKYGRIGFQPFEAPGGGTVDYGSQAKGSIDLGLLWSTPWRLDLAYVARDLMSPRYQFIEGSSGGELPLRHELGAAWKWNRESTVTAAWSQIDGSGATSLNVGIEIWFYEVFAIRSGLTNLSPIVESTGSPNEFEFTGGFGVEHQGVHVDAVAVTSHDLGVSYRASLRIPLVRGAP